MKTLTPARKACNEPRTGGGLACGGPTVRGSAQAGEKLAKAASLGIYAKYKPRPSSVDSETGEIMGLDPMSTRLQRFMLQAVARSFFPKSRLDKCLRLRASNADIQVWKSKEHQTTHYKGLQTCGSVWRCPICAAKISERRRVEVKQAMDAHKAAGGCVNLLTLTCPHQVKDDLVELLAKQAKALNNFWKDRTVKAIFSEMGTVGQIKATETTNGRLSAFNNGWHPHYHVLMFQGAGVDLMRFDHLQMRDWEVRLYLRWAARCKAAGLGEPSMAHGLKLDDGSKAESYATKWGLEDEMTKGHTKKAMHGETPFDLLRAYQDNPEDKQAAALFIEFAKAFEGKRQLHWSKGLKKRYLVEDKSDEALAAETEDSAWFLGMVTLPQWRDVLAVEGRHMVLSLAASSGWVGVLAYLEEIKGKGVKK